MANSNTLIQSANTGEVIKISELVALGGGGGGGSGLTPDQLAKLNGIEVGAQKNPDFKTINGNEITGTGDIAIEASAKNDCEFRNVTNIDGITA